MKKGFDKKGAIAISQIFLLIVSIFAISYVIGGSIGLVSGDGYDEFTLGEPKPPVTSVPAAGLSPYGPYKSGYKFPPQSLPEGVDLPTVDTINPPGIQDPLPPATSPLSNLGGAVLEGAIWAAVAYGIVKLAGSIFGKDGSETYFDAGAKAAAAGVFTAKTGLVFSGNNFFVGNSLALTGTGITTLGIGLGVAAVVYFATFEREKAKIVTFTCLPWDAPTGGDYCELCNKQGDLPCSEYQCRSLGQACQLLNQGTDEENCVWVNRNDVNPPIIQPWEDALLYGYEYDHDESISPPDRGVNILNKNPDNTDNCIPAFTPLSFGINTNEPAKCKVDIIRKDSFDEMDYLFGGSSISKYNHTQVMSLPGPSALEAENITIQNDGEYELYVRCQDANGNYNIGNFIFQYCVDEGPDTTPPLIVATDWFPPEGGPIAFNQSEVDLELYTNEPADCKWTHNTDKDYERMEGEMDCSSSIFEMNAQMLYRCSTTLTGLKDRTENKFFFRCEDQPLLEGTDKESDRNLNVEGYEFTLIGTQPLVIDSVSPNNETIRDSTDVVQVNFDVETSAGYKEGESGCYYREREDEDDEGEDNGGYVLFLDDEGFDNYKHLQPDLYHAEGYYEYFIKCIDLGGNFDVKEINFTIETDRESPIIVRAYHEESFLKIITDEDAECVYDTVDCSYPFEDGIAMTSVEEREHFVDWNTKDIFYVKCRDEYGTQPNPNECNMIVTPFEDYAEVFDEED